MTENQTRPMRKVLIRLSLSVDGSNASEYTSPVSGIKAVGDIDLDKTDNTNLCSCDNRRTKNVFVTENKHVMRTINGR